jgi:hypothetical protein
MAVAQGLDRDKEDVDQTYKAVQELTKSLG